MPHDISSSAENNFIPTMASFARKIPVNLSRYVDTRSPFVTKSPKNKYDISRRYKLHLFVTLPYDSPLLHPPSTTSFWLLLSTCTFLDALLMPSRLCKFFANKLPLTSNAVTDEGEFSPFSEFSANLIPTIPSPRTP